MLCLQTTSSWSRGSSKKVVYLTAIYLKAVYLTRAGQSATDREDDHNLELYTASSPQFSRSVSASLPPPFHSLPHQHLGKQRQYEVHSCDCCELRGYCSCARRPRPRPRTIGWATRGIVVQHASRRRWNSSMRFQLEGRRAQAVTDLSSGRLHLLWHFYIRSSPLPPVSV